ncbi:MAG: hypothetical protein AB1480_01380 [Nitrospirota bacterium]
MYIDVPSDIPDVVTIEPNDNDFDGYQYATWRVIPPGAHAAFRASFKSPGTIAFGLSLTDPRVYGYTLSDILLASFGVVSVEDIISFSNAVFSIPSLNSFYIHIGNAMNAESMGDLAKELKEARKDIKELIKNPSQLEPIVEELSKIGIKEVTTKSLKNPLLKAGMEAIKAFVDIVVYSIQTGFNTKTMQINVIAY